MARSLTHHRPVLSRINLPPRLPPAQNALQRESSASLGLFIVYQTSLSTSRLLSGAPRSSFTTRRPTLRSCLTFGDVVVTKRGAAGGFLMWALLAGSLGL